MPVPEEFSREAMLIGESGYERLKNARVAVFGLGGVGSYAAEALARSGIGHMMVVDNDTVSESNINRQLYALHSTVGQLKTQVCTERIHDINPECLVDTRSEFYCADNADLFPLEEMDYVIDAIDSVTSKLLLIERCNALGVPIICCMGTGNHLDAAKLQIAYIEQTSVCPLARVMRRELKARGIKKVKCIYSSEEAVKVENPVSDGVRRAVPGSVSFVPSVAGLMLAGEVVRSLLEK